MKHQTILFYLLVLILLSCSKNPILNKEYLTSNGWEDKYLTLSFENNNVFHVAGIAGGYLTGTYKIDNNKLYLKSNKSINYNIDFNNLECLLINDNNDLSYQNFLLCNPGNVRFGNSNSKTISGMIRKFNGIDIIIDNKPGITITNARLREKPSTNSKIIEFNPDLSSTKVIPYIPAKSNLFVYGHIKEKSKIDGKENYWYYVSAQQPAQTYSLGVNGWMFGEFIKFDENI